MINSGAATRAKRANRPAAETRLLVLDVAEQLFYRDGIRATGVDAIARAAGIAPVTLYRLFASKDDLVAAYVDRFATGYRQWIDELTADPDLPARTRILAVIDGLLDNTGDGGFRGCPFLMALAEYPDPGSAPHVSAQALKAWVRAKLRELVAQVPGVPSRSRSVVADQLALVVEGIYASTAALGAGGPAKRARPLAALVIDSAAGGPAN